MGALYAPADNQARFQTTAYFSHQLPLSARVAAGAGVPGKGGSPMCGLHVDMSTRRGPAFDLDELSGPDRGVDEIMNPSRTAYASRDDTALTWSESSSMSWNSTSLESICSDDPG